MEGYLMEVGMPFLWGTCMFAACLSREATGWQLRAREHQPAVGRKGEALAMALRVSEQLSQFQCSFEFLGWCLVG